MARKRLLLNEIAELLYNSDDSVESFIDVMGKLLKSNLIMVHSNTLVHWCISFHIIIWLKKILNLTAVIISRASPFKIFQPSPSEIFHPSPSEIFHPSPSEIFPSRARLRYSSRALRRYSSRARLRYSPAEPV
jgi:hypothetical protein